MGATKIMVIRHAEKPGSYNQKRILAWTRLERRRVMTGRSTW
jgi:hypothetical protein